MCLSVCIFFFLLQLLLKEWVLELNARPMVEKRSYQVIKLMHACTCNTVKLVYIVCNDNAVLKNGVA